MANAVAARKGPPTGWRAKPPSSEAAVGSITVAPKLLAVILQACGAQPWKAVLVDRTLPGQEFIDGQRVSLAGFLDAEETAAHSRYHFRLAPDDPTLGVPRGKIGDRERRPVRSDHVAPARSHLLFGHDTQYTLSDHMITSTSLPLN